MEVNNFSYNILLNLIIVCVEVATGSLMASTINYKEKK